MSVGLAIGAHAQKVCKSCIGMENTKIRLYAACHSLLQSCAINLLISSTSSNSTQHNTSAMYTGHTVSSTPKHEPTKNRAVSTFIPESVKKRISTQSEHEKYDNTEQVQSISNAEISATSGSQFINTPARAYQMLHSAAMKHPHTKVLFRPNSSANMKLTSAPNE